MQKLSDVVEHFLAEWPRRRALEPATRRMYEYHARAFVIPALGDRDLDDINHLDLEALYNSLIERGYDPSSVQKTHTSISSMYRHAMREGWTEKNPTQIAEPPRKLRKELIVPTPADVKGFLATAAEVDPDLHDFAFTLAMTGMRPGEGVAIKPTDLEGSTLLVSRALDISEGAARVKGTKTGKVRRVNIDEQTIDIIRRRSGEWVFSGDQPWRQDSTAHRFRVLCKSIGVKLTPRQLRHFHATELLASNRLSIRQVSDRLGHANPNITLSTYARFVPSLDVVAAEVMTGVLCG